jgi:hypothetical protein
MIFCPKCKSQVDFNSYHQRYMCLSRECDWSLEPNDMTDEDRIYFNKQEGYERWELNEPVEDLCFMENSMDVRIKWKDDMVQCLSLEDILKAICKIARKEIRAIK